MKLKFIKDTNKYNKRPKEILKLNNMKQKNEDIVELPVTSLHGKNEQILSLQSREKELFNDEEVLHLMRLSIMRFVSNPNMTTQDILAEYKSNRIINH